MNPAAFPRRILLAVTGLTPQVLTETLYALAVARQEPWVPTEVRVITTAEGAERARQSLLDQEAGQFHALCRDYGLAGIAFPAENVRTLIAADGRPLADIRTPEDNTLAADALLAEVRALCGDPDSALHVSIAGGRKTMGFFLGYALSLFGRPQDRLSHVLVSEPFESLPEFYFPPAQPRSLLDRQQRRIQTTEARVMLAEIPFVRLREGLPSAALAQSAPFASLVAAAQDAVNPPALHFDLRGRTVYCAGKAVALPPALLAWYAWLAECRTTGLGDHGFVGYRDVTPQRLLELYEAILGPDHGSLDKARKRFAGGFETQVFSENRSEINRKLEEALSLAAGPYRIANRGRRPDTRYGLDLAAERIAFANGPPGRME